MNGVPGPKIGPPQGVAQGGALASVAVLARGYQSALRPAPRQRGKLLKIVASPASSEAKKYATLNLLDFSIHLIEGEIEIALPGL